MSSKLTKWTEAGLRTAEADLVTFDLIYIENEDTEPLFEYLNERGYKYLTVDRGDYLVVSLVHTTGKAARRA